MGMRHIYIKACYLSLEWWSSGPHLVWNDGRCHLGVVVALVDGLSSVGLGLVAHSLAPSVKK